MRVLACLLGLLLPVQAAALSCVPSSVSEMFNEVNAADNLYFVFLGEVTYVDVPVSREPAEPPSDAGFPEQPYRDARMKGLLLAAVGKGRPVDEKIRIAHYCIGDWCGAMPSGQEVLAFVEKKRNRLHHPCWTLPKWRVLKPIETDVAECETVLGRSALSKI